MLFQQKELYGIKEESWSFYGRASHPVFSERRVANEVVMTELQR